MTTISFSRSTIGGRRAGGREHAEPVEQLVALEPGRAVLQRRDVGQLRHALERGDGDRAQLAGLISGSAAARLEKLMVTAPVATSVTAGAAPRYGTCSTSVPAMMFISSPASCCGLPTPDDENDSLPALALA